MSADEHQAEVESAPSSCSTTTSGLSPPAEEYASREFTSNTQPATFRKRIGKILRNVSDAHVVGAAFDYVKDVNERSPLVRSVSGRLRPIVDMASPVVSAVVGRFDNGLDATCRIVDKCVARSQAFPASFSSDSSPLLNSVTSKFEMASLNIRGRIRLLWATSQSALEEMSRRKEALYKEVIRRKNSLIDELPTFPYSTDVLTAIPRQCYCSLINNFISGVELAHGHAQFVIAKFLEQGQSWAYLFRDIAVSDPRLKLMRSYLAGKYESTCLQWEMLYPRIADGWDNVTKAKPAAVQQKFVAAKESIRHMAADKTKNLVLLVPEESRLNALEMNTRLFSILRRYIGDKQADSALGILRTILQIYN